MKFMILVKATKDSEAGVMPTQDLMTEIERWHRSGRAEQRNSHAPAVFGLSRAISYTRYLLTSLAAVAFGLAAN